MKTLILTPNANKMCGMYQLAKDLAKEFNADIRTRDNYLPIADYDTLITFLHPMHELGRKAKEMGKKWICYDQQVPPATKQNYPNFFRRQYHRLFAWINTRSMRGADEYWELSEREQKPKWTEKKKTLRRVDIEMFGIYLGRRTDYKNFNWLEKTMADLNIPFRYSNNWTDDEIYGWLSDAKMLVSASLWEGYGRPVM